MSRAFPVRTILFGSAALVLAAGTAWLSQTVAADRAPAPSTAPAAFPVKSVLVAARPLAAGALVTSDDLAFRPWPSAGIDPGFVTEGTRPLSAFVGTVARTPMAAGEPVTKDRLGMPGSGGALAVMLERGLRAVSVAINPTSGVSGLIVPGDRVDVILTYALPQPGGGAESSGFERRAATTILTGLRVLAVDQRLSGGADAKEVRNASLEVTAKQSEALALAADLGKLSLSLRSLDTSPGAGVAGSTVDYQVGRLLPGLGARRTSARRAPSAPRSTALVEFHGGKTGAGSTQ